MPFETLPYFHARLISFWGPARTIHRIYITETDFLFVHLGIKTLSPEDQAEHGTVTSGGGLVFAAIGYCVALMDRERLNRTAKALEAADEAILREFVEEDKDSFLVPISEVQDVRLEQKTVWSSLLCGDLLAFLSFTCASRGPMTLGLVAPHEMPTVASEMQRLFGELPCDSWRAF